jgi:acetoin utilization deacetylase AcuC-like enzyme
MSPSSDILDRMTTTPLDDSIPRPRIPVLFAHEQVAEPQLASPSASKPRDVVLRWQQRGYPIDLLRPQPAEPEDLYRAHDRTYVDAVLECRELNGFGNRSASVAASLPWTSGSMLSAARHALAGGGVACAPCSGFHHAHWDAAAGFCTFNGLMVTVLALRAGDGARRIGILDCDQHYGDGTEDIIVRRRMHDGVRHVTAGRDYPRHAARFLASLPGIVRSFADCDLMLYQAGADPHVDDPLGGYLDDEQLARRDAIVFGEACAMGLPVAWNLAGGYQEPLSKVLDVHDRTMAACVAAYC